LKVTILGSGTLFPDDERRSAAHYVHADRLHILLDCGSGTVHGMARSGVPWRELTHIAISHFHTDHVGDLPALLFALKHGLGDAERGPLTVFGPPGVRAFWRALAAAYGDHMTDPGIPFEIVELERSDERPLGDGGATLRTHPTPHTDDSVAFRIETKDGVVGYSGDTGPDPALGNFFAGVDLLICECSLPDPSGMDTHLTPRGVAEIASAAGAGTVVATHLFPVLDPERVPELIRGAGFRGRVVTGRDGMEIDLKSENGASA
jgi:ribonuclease BN (tRNA processing enzyme)